MNLFCLLFSLLFDPNDSFNLISFYHFFFNFTLTVCGLFNFVSYNTIRLAHDLPVTEAFSDFRQVIENGYYSKMSTTTSVRNIPPRQNNVYLHDLRRDADAVVLKVSDLERSRDRIIECIDQGFVYDVRYVLFL